MRDGTTTWKTTTLFLYDYVTLTAHCNRKTAGLSKMKLDDRLHRPPTAGFYCGERMERIVHNDDDDDNGVQIGSSVVIFYCSLPVGSSALHESNENHGDALSTARSNQCFTIDRSRTSSSTMALLNFHCREPSCGALQGDEIPAVWDTKEEELEHYGIVDPNFFDEGYTMAGATGFKVWTGTRLLIETLGWPQPSIDGCRLLNIQQCLVNGANVIELGAGVGVVGTYLSYMGANVLLTDLPTLVKHAIRPNLVRNALSSSNNDDYCMKTLCPSWLQHPTHGGLKIGKGWAACTPLDWTIPIHEQLSMDRIKAVDFIVASDVVFLLSMLDSLLHTVATMFEESSSLPGRMKTFILSFQRRDAQDGEESSSFTTVNTILKAIQDRGWKLECLSWRPVTVPKETSDGKTLDDLSEVFVFEIRKGR
jgi:hypothetical protein